MVDNERPSSGHLKFKEKLFKLRIDSGMGIFSFGHTKNGTRAKK